MIIINVEFETSVLANSSREASSLVGQMVLSLVEENKLENVMAEMMEYTVEYEEDTDEGEDTFDVYYSATYETTYSEEEFIQKFNEAIMVNSKPLFTLIEE